MAQRPKLEMANVVGLSTPSHVTEVSDVGQVLNVER